ncbi:MAG: glycosyltransferase family 39 protein [Anaerolineae bacterium]|nr:glycosyltransferase family 39 protein [Anaerolineae bacterium]
MLRHAPAARSRLSFYLLACLLLIVLWWSRIHALEALPLHNDEGLHLTRAVEVWNGHPFWAISDGKIINHWLIAAFYPQNAPVFTGRIATVFVALIGLAAAFGLAHRLGNALALVLAGGLWIGASYLFFYERMAFSDAAAGALGLWALLASLRLARTGRVRDAILTGVVLALALLFKFTAAPFALGAALIVLGVSRAPFMRRVVLITIVALVVAALFAVPLAYLIGRGADFFAVALDWVGAGSGGGGITLVENTEHLIAILRDLQTGTWPTVLSAGLALALVLGNKSLRLLLVAVLLPLLIILVLGQEAQSRHFVVTLPPLIAAAGIGLGLLAARLRLSLHVPFVALVILSLALAFVPFAFQAYDDPAELSLPDLMRSQYVRDHSSGYGLREAVLAFPQTITRRDLPIIASMFPDSCRRANFYLPAGFQPMTCADAPGLSQIEAALADHGAAYVLVESGGLIGVDASQIDAQATLLGAYPRPGEPEADASVRLWLLERANP